MDLFLDVVEPGRTSHRLLGGWRDILEDTEKLAAAMERLPEHCPCGTGDAHLGGRCACCIGEIPVRGCVDCDALLRHIADRIEALRADDLHFVSALRDFTHRRPDQVQMLQRLDDVSRRTSQLVQTVERVQVAAADFRQGCRADQLARLKERVRELRDEARQLDRQW